MAKFEVPIIDVSALVARDGDIESRRRTALKIGAACRDVGKITALFLLPTCSE
jgi:hypothetical protein